MEIIESYKKKARESLANVLTSIHDEDEEGLQTATEEPNPMKKQLIQEINAPESTVEADYQSQQFQFYSKIVKEKPSKCVVCKKVSPKYTCPKCKVRYCSSDHFKTHNLFCTERFYKNEVEALMKRTKAATVEKKKMVQFLRVHGEEMAQSEGQVMEESKIEEIPQKRLEEIMAALQEDRQVNLSDNQMKCFEKYLREIQEYSLEQNDPTKQKTQPNDEELEQLFEEYVPFWQIEEGLDQYFFIDQPISIESFNKSNHKDLLKYRQQVSSNFRKDIITFTRGISFKKTSIFVVYDVVQITYIISLLFRTYNGEYMTNADFSEIFLKLYQEDLSKIIAESQPINVSELVLSSFPEVLPFLKTKMTTIESDLLEILKGWLPFVVDDSIKILKNKYLCLEALYRMLQIYRSKTNNNKKYMNNRAKMVKKLEFLLTFTSQILYAPSKNNQKLPEQFIKTNALQLVQNILKRDRNSEQSQAKAIKLICEAQNNQKKKKIQKILIS